MWPYTVGAGAIVMEFESVRDLTRTMSLFEHMYDSM